MTKERVHFNLDEIIMALSVKYPNKRKSVHEAVNDALDMLSDEIIEVASNYLDMRDND